MFQKVKNVLNYNFLSAPVYYWIILVTIVLACISALTDL